MSNEKIVTKRGFTWAERSIVVAVLLWVVAGFYAWHAQASVAGAERRLAAANAELDDTKIRLAEIEAAITSDERDLFAIRAERDEARIKLAELAEADDTITQLGEELTTALAEKKDLDKKLTDAKASERVAKADVAVWGKYANELNDFIEAEYKHYIFGWNYKRPQIRRWK